MNANNVVKEIKQKTYKSLHPHRDDTKQGDIFESIVSSNIYMNIGDGGSGVKYVDLQTAELVLLDNIRIRILDGVSITRGKA